MKQQTHDQLAERRFNLLIRALEFAFPSYKNLIIRSFIQGIFFGLGTTIGVTLVVALATFFITSLKIIPEIDYLIQQSQVEEVFESSF